MSLNHANLYEHWQGNVVSIPQRTGRNGEQKAPARSQTAFNAYSARSTSQERAQRDWTANAKPRKTVAVAKQPAATVPAVHEPAPAPAPKPQPAPRQNNVFVTQTGEIYRRTPAPAPAAHETQPAVQPPATHETEPAVKPAVRETVSRQPAQPAVWEQQTTSGWQPAAENSNFKQAAPQLNREAAAREVGETRTVSSQPAAPAPATRPIVTSRPAPQPSTPSPAPSRQENDNTRTRKPN
jgi:hypothetical protein